MSNVVSYSQSSSTSSELQESYADITSDDDQNMYDDENTMSAEELLENAGEDSDMTNIDGDPEISGLKN